MDRFGTVFGQLEAVLSRLSTEDRDRATEHLARLTSLISQPSVQTQEVTHSPQNVVNYQETTGYQVHTQLADDRSAVYDNIASPVVATTANLQNYAPNQAGDPGLNIRQHSVEHTTRLDGGGELSGIRDSQFLAKARELTQVAASSSNIQINQQGHISNNSPKTCIEVIPPKDPRYISEVYVKCTPFSAPTVTHVSASDQTFISEHNNSSYVYAGQDKFSSTTSGGVSSEMQESIVGRVYPGSSEVYIEKESNNSYPPAYADHAEIVVEEHIVQNNLTNSQEVEGKRPVVNEANANKSDHQTPWLHHNKQMLQKIREQEIEFANSSRGISPPTHPKNDLLQTAIVDSQLTNVIPSVHYPLNSLPKNNVEKSYGIEELGTEMETTDSERRKGAGDASEMFNAPNNEVFEIKDLQSNESDPKRKGSEISNKSPEKDQSILILKEQLWKQSISLPSTGPIETYMRAMLDDIVSKAAFLTEPLNSESDLTLLLERVKSVPPPTPAVVVVGTQKRKRGRPPTKRSNHDMVSVENPVPDKVKEKVREKVKGKVKEKVKEKQTESPRKRRGRPPKKRYLEETYAAELNQANKDNTIIIKQETTEPDEDGENGMKLRRRAKKIKQDPDEQPQLINSNYKNSDKGLKIPVKKSIINKPSSRRKKKGGKHRKIYRHKCKLCDEQFFHGRSFKSHLLTHGEGRLCCIICRVEFANEALLLNHDCDCGAPETQPKKCPHCEEVFTSIRLWVKHRRVAHDEKRLPRTVSQICSYCDATFSNRSNLYLHYQNEHSDSKSVCMKCGKFFADEVCLAEHQKKEHDPSPTSFACTQCEYTCKRRQRFDAHMESHKQYRCEECDRDFRHKRKLLEHKEIEHGIPIPDTLRHICDVCGKALGSPGKLKIHYRLHTGERPEVCTVCRMYFRTPKALNKHKETYTHLSRCGEISREREHLCSLCGKSYFRKQALQRHMRYHTGEKPFFCPHCGYNCREHTNLKRHMELHFSKRNFVCETCGSSFHAKKTLETHYVYKHSEERNFMCESCPLTFKTPNALRRHSKVHSNLRSHKCPHCELGFNRQYNLRRHLQVVHGSDAVLPPSRKVRLLDAEEPPPPPTPGLESMHVVQTSTEIVNKPVRKRSPRRPSGYIKTTEGAKTMTVEELNAVRHEDLMSAHLLMQVAQSDPAPRLMQVVQSEQSPRMIEAEATPGNWSPISNASMQHQPPEYMDMAPVATAVEGASIMPPPVPGSYQPLVPQVVGQLMHSVIANYQATTQAQLEENKALLQGTLPATTEQSTSHQSAMILRGESPLVSYMLAHPNYQQYQHQDRPQ